MNTLDSIYKDIEKVAESKLAFLTKEAIAPGTAGTKLKKFYDKIRKLVPENERLIEGIGKKKLKGKIDDTIKATAGTAKEVTKKVNAVNKKGKPYTKTITESVPTEGIGQFIDLKRIPKALDGLLETVRPEIRDLKGFNPMITSQNLEGIDKSMELLKQVLNTGHTNINAIAEASNIGLDRSSKALSWLKKFFAEKLLGRSSAP